MTSGLLSDVLTGLVTAGAFAAFLSTSSGLSIAVAGVLGQDVFDHAFSRRLRGVSAFRLGCAVAVVVPLLVALALPNLGVARAVGLAFAVAASTFCPLLVLGIWWRRLTDAGAVAGLLVGFIGSGSAVVWAMASLPTTGTAVLLEQPAAWSVPLAFATMVLVSLRTQQRVPMHTRRFLARLHSPESLVQQPVADRSSV
jgi:cation/acetate symporter